MTSKRETYFLVTRTRNHIFKTDGKVIQVVRVQRERNLIEALTENDGERAARRLAAAYRSRK